MKNGGVSDRGAKKVKVAPTSKVEMIACSIVKTLAYAVITFVVDISEGSTENILSSVPSR